MKNLKQIFLATVICSAAQISFGQNVNVTVNIENIGPENGVAITPVWVGFHSGSFDSYNGGLRALPGLERVAEDGDTSLVSAQFNDFNPSRGGYTYVDNSRNKAKSRLVRTGDLTDANRQDATLGSAPLLPGQSASQSFTLKHDGSNRYFSYLSMVLPSNDFFLANGSPVAHDLSGILANGGQVTFLIGTPDGGVNDAGTEREDFMTSAGNGLFPNRNLPDGQSGPNQGAPQRRTISNVIGNPFANFSLLTPINTLRVKLATQYVRTIQRFLQRFSYIPAVRNLIYQLEADLAAFRQSLKIDVDGLNFNQYEGGIARVTISASAK